jgi:hypothetical protein
LPRWWSWGSAMSHKCYSEKRENSPSSESHCCSQATELREFTLGVGSRLQACITELWLPHHKVLLRRGVEWCQKEAAPTPPHLQPSISSLPLCQPDQPVKDGP